MSNLARVAKGGPESGKPRNVRQSRDHVVLGPRRLDAALTAGRRPGVAGPTRPAGPRRNAEPAPTLVSAAARAASANVALVADSLQGAAEALGSGAWRTGRCLLAQGTSSVRTLLLVTDMLASVPGLRAARRSSLEVVLTCVRATLTAIESKRVRGDWDGVIEVLDEDMASLLSDWATELGEIGGEAADPPLPVRLIESDRALAPSEAR